ncbi:MAG: hypothetical protein QM496_01860 [Verrucomicrobiota bacterium]
MKLLFNYLYKLLFANLRNWKTTTAGISQIAAAIGVFTGHLGGDEISAEGGEALQNLVALILAMSGVNGFFSRDANVSSQSSKARPKGGFDISGVNNVLPIFLMAAAAFTLASCSTPAGQQIGSVFKGLSGRIGTDGGGGIAEVTLPPGYGVGIKVYPVTPISSKLPQITPMMTSSYPPAKNVE